MKLQILTKILLSALGILCIASVAYAWERRAYSDAEIVSRAELIVVAKIKESSMVLVPHDTKNQGASWEHHLELLISEVLKGQTSATSMVVSIHYGLDPVVGGYSSNQFRFMNLRGLRTNYPKDVVEVFDTGNSAMSVTPITGDIRTNHIWLLHHVQSPHHNDSDMIGVRDPEDIQPIHKKEELLKHVK